MSFDTTPKPVFLRAMQSSSWSVSGALAELIDNSFGRGRGNATWIKIEHDAGKRELVVIDNGAGMQQVGQLFQLGNTIGRTAGDIGEYGSGGTLALLWLARDVSIWTLRDGMVNMDRIVWEQCIARESFPAVSDTWVPATMMNTPAPLLEFGRGTMIAMKLQKERSIRPANVIRDLGRIYAPGLRQNKLLTWQETGKRGSEPEPIGDPLHLPGDLDQRVDFDTTIFIDDHALGVRGSIGSIEGLAIKDASVAIGFGARVIMRTREFYSSPDGVDRYTAKKIAGHLDLSDGWQQFLATTKNKINDQRAWDALRKYVFEQLRPLLEAEEEQNTSLVFNNIAFGIGIRLGELATMQRLGVLIPDEDGTARAGRRFGSEDPDRDEPATRRARFEDDDEGTVVNVPGGSMLTIVRSTNEELNKCLCKILVNGPRDVRAMVNVDHITVQRALNAEPIMQLALEYLVTRELADHFADDQEAMKALFPKLFEDLTVLDRADRAQTLHRLFMDDVVRDPHAA